MLWVHSSTHEIYTLQNPEDLFTSDAGKVDGEDS